jgi:hypothetical protein
MYNLDEEYKYKVIRAKNEYIKIRIDNLKIENYTLIEGLSLYNVANASMLWCLTLREEELKDNIDTCGNKLNLINIDESQFKIKINEIYNKRKNIII